MRKTVFSRVFARPVWLFAGCLLMGGTAFSDAAAQSLLASGKVSDAADGSPVPGVSVLVKGTMNGTVTDFDGNFSVSCAQGDSLLFSFIGYKALLLPAAQNIDARLEQETERLEDVVVIGYGVSSRRDLTGSVATLRPDEQNRGLTTNPQDLMQGKIAGVNVTGASGAPGAGATIRIRGGSSLNASNNPLIVIDGLAMDQNGVTGLGNPLSMVTPADIESFSVLKDASATAIYGSRGSNGVIIITTKKGRLGQAPQLTYNGNVGVAVIGKRMDIMDANEYSDYVRKRFGGDSKEAAQLGNADTDWQEEIFRAAATTDHNLTVQGAAGLCPYRLTAGYTGQQGVLDKSDFRRGTVSLNLNPRLLDGHLTVNAAAKAMYAKTVYTEPEALWAAMLMDPTMPARSEDMRYVNFGGYAQNLTVGGGAAYNDPNWTDSFNHLGPANPRSLIDLKDDEAKSKSFVGNIEADYKLHGLEDLKAHVSLGGDWSTGTRTVEQSPQYPDRNWTYYGLHSEETTDKYNLSLSAYMQWAHNFDAASQHFDIMGGYEWQHFHREGHKEGWGIYPDTNNNAALRGSRHNAYETPSATENFIVSFFGRTNYQLLNQLLLTATLRYDGSSRFKDHWAAFPSAALGWRLKELGSLKDSEALSDLKLRLGYGKTGQQEGIGDYNHIITYTQNTNADSFYPAVVTSLDAGQKGATQRTEPYNPDLKWETTATFNAGIDLGFTDQRISASLDFYRRKTTDLINDVYMAAGSNYSNKVTANVGALVNTGFEISVNAKPIMGDRLTWEINGNMAYNVNEITDLNGGPDYYVPLGSLKAATGNYAQAHKKGYAAGSFYVYEQLYWADGSPRPGEVKDRNGDGVINEADKYICKQPAPPLTLGFTSRWNVANWDFGFALRSCVGNYVFNDVQCFCVNMPQAVVYEGAAYLRNTLKPVAKLEWSGTSVKDLENDHFVQDASFLKCDYFTVGYTFGQAAGGKLSGRIHFSLNNVFCVTDYEGLDPEVDGGIDNNIYPRPVTGLLGLTLNL